MRVFDGAVVLIWWSGFVERFVLARVHVSFISLVYCVLVCEDVCVLD